MKIFMPFLTCLLAFNVGSYAQTVNQEKTPIKVSRVVVDIEEGKIIGVLNKTKQGDEIKPPSDKIGFRYTRDFRISSSFHEENFKEVLEKELTKKDFDVEGWGNTFIELNKSSKPILALAFHIEEFLFNYYYSGSSLVIDNFHSKLKIKTLILNTNTNTIILKKSIISNFFSEDFGQSITKDDVNQYTLKALAQFISELVEDLDFKKAIEEVKNRSTYPTNYEKIIVAITPPKADRLAALKSSLDATVTIVTGGKYGSGAIISKDGLVLTCSHCGGRQRNHGGDPEQ